MSEDNLSYRVRMNVGSGESYVNVKLDQDYDTFEFLSMKVDTSSIYKTHSAKYGCIVGRVLANGNFGVPNAKISVFISVNETTQGDSIFDGLYPYESVTSQNTDGVRYNLLPDEKVSDCHQAVGTFPNKRLVLDDNNVIEIYDEYYKYTTVSNGAGDYIIMGVPVGMQTIHTDIDLSDIGILSQKPRDMIYKGYNITQFENANMFKSGTNLDNLTQIISENTPVYVYPFWGDEDEDIVSITRNDIQVNYQFEPTCVFIGSMITDDNSNGVSKKCKPTERMGKMDRITTGTGTIEMIRRKPDGSVESYEIMGNQLIDGNGTWCYQIPMNLDYMMTDEYGNMVPTNDPDKGIPTRTSVRFRVSIADTSSDYENNHMSKLLIPNNPHSYSDLDYEFGSDTTEDSFRDLFWNNVYTVKSYIPRIQKGNHQKTKDFTGIKVVNVNNGNNPIPYNNIRVELTFMFVLQCAMIKFMIVLVTILNAVLCKIPTKVLTVRLWSRKCAVIGGGACPELDGWYFAPGCCTKDSTMKNTLNALSDDGDTDDTSSTVANNTDSEDSNICLTMKINYFMQCIEINLAQEYEAIKFDFYNDWLNGVCYIPRWFVNIRKKRSYLFGLIHSKAKVEACFDTSTKHIRRYVQQCALKYGKQTGELGYRIITTPNGCKNNSSQKCHKANGRIHVNIFNGSHKNGGGLVHTEQTIKNQSVYYFKPAEWINNNNKYGTRVNLFLTDIVLLGSLTECNTLGIPQSFKDLKSSSYKMPSNLAATNMDSEGYMYGFEGGGTVCKKKIVTSSVKQYSPTFSDYITWTKNLDSYEKNPDPDESPEYAVTEQSGVDWGYNGPNQGNSDFSKLYQPGGHFLGVGCLTSETNIKSCINLSRACEFGTTFSERKYIVRKKENGDLSYSYLIPTGLISRDELTDTNFRAEFATLNHNRLKTVIDPLTGYRRYDFIPLMPINFNGELNKIVWDNELYNTTTDRGDPDDSDKQNPKDTTTRAFKRTIEDCSDDYYRFRLGIRNDDDKVQDRYLYVRGGVVALPMYENSYYFYFGLKDGNTAFDRFISTYFADCPTESEEPSKIRVSATNCTTCNPSTGTASIEIVNMENPYTINFYKDNAKKNLILTDSGTSTYTATETYTDESMTTYDRKLNLTGLTAGEYTIEVIDTDGNDVTKSFSVSEELPELIENMDVIPYDFIDISDVYDIVSYGGIKEGKIVIRNSSSDDETVLLGYLVKSDEYYSALFDGSISAYDIKNSSSSYIFDDDPKDVTTLYPQFKAKGSLSDSEVTFYAWAGNESYDVYAFYRCSNGKYGLKSKLLDTVKVEMDTDIDIYVGSSNLTFRKDIAKCGSGYTTTDWVIGMLNDKGNEKRKWTLERALFYQNSVYEFGGGSIIVGYTNGTSPVTEYKFGIGEYFTGDSGDNLMFGGGMYGSDSAYTMDFKEIIYPTLGGPAAQTFTNGYTVQQLVAWILRYQKQGVPGKAHYRYTVVNGNKTQLPYYSSKPSIASAINQNGLCLPSIYRPFYFHAVMFIMPQASEVWVQFSVANGITYNGRFDSVQINGVDFTDELGTTEFGDDTVDIGDCVTSKYGCNIYHNRIIKLYDENGQSVYGEKAVEINADPDEKTIRTFTLSIEDGTPESDDDEGLGSTQLRETCIAEFYEQASRYSNSGIHYFNCKDYNGFRQKVTGQILGYSGGSTPYVSETMNSQVQNNTGKQTFVNACCLSEDASSSIGWNGNNDKDKFFNNTITGGHVNSEITIEEDVEAEEAASGSTDYIYKNSNFNVPDDGFVMGVYDNKWCRSTDAYTTSSKNKWDYVTKHTNVISIVRIYTKDEFRAIMGW